MSKWKEIESYMDSKSVNESKFNITRKQAQMILDLKKDELKKMRFLAMLDIDKDEVKKLGKIDPSIVKAIGKQGGSFRTAMVRKRANEEVKEDAPTNNASSGAVDMNPTGMSLKKKKELDARTKEYKIHARKLMAQREKRKLNAKKSLCGSFRKGVEESLNSFSREEFIEEDNIATLKNIVKRKQAMPLKFKDGTMKIDLLQQVD
tara:strand:+ start:317 stop:931 length:615 start_codon:yes stop_codon:yes gene_type:complete